jgi:hypothetical protein
MFFQRVLLKLDKNRNLLSIVKQLFDSTSITNVKPKTAEANKSHVICCPFCSSQMILVLTLQRIKYNDISPPLNNYFFIINKELLAIN